MTTREGAPLTGVSYWQGVWDHIGAKGERVTGDATFDHLLDTYLPKSAELDSVEIGCFPGTYMLEFGRRFGYRVSGIDFVPAISKLKPVLEQEGIRVGELIEADFLAYESPRTFDVVASFGFIEHFENVELLLEKHARLVGENGHLVVELPHFRGAHYWLRRGLEPALLDSHNLDAMVPGRYRRWLENNGFEVEYCDYYMTFDFWLSSEAPNLDEHVAPVHRATMWGTVLAKRALKALGLQHVPNRWFSPYIVVIARRKAATK